MNIYKKFVEFLREVRVEMSKVSWPTKDEIIGSTVVVLVVVAILSAFIGVSDVIINKILEKVILRK